MRALTMGSVAMACLALTAGTVMLTARGQQSRPGEIGEAHVLVDNRHLEQAIPVVLVQRNPDPLRVQVMGTHTVRVDPTSAVGTRTVRQPWEYRTMTVAAGQDPAASLASAGLDGWEAVGFQSGQGGVTVLLKRPR